ncbi:hypothetical protein [Aliamphritea spongicola]|nr:hypothetical protein [Aliamphritea spongicola]
MKQRNTPAENHSGNAKSYPDHRGRQQLRQYQTKQRPAPRRAALDGIRLRREKEILLANQGWGGIPTHMIEEELSSGKLVPSMLKATLLAIRSFSRSAGVMQIQVSSLRPSGNNLQNCKRSTESTGMPAS